MQVPKARGSDEIELKMTPMIDVVFLLLIFFLWTSSFEKPEYKMPSAVADPPETAGSETATTKTVEPFDEVVIGLSVQGQQTIYRMNENEMTSLAALRGRLEQVAELGVQPPVIVDPEQDVPVGSAIEVYDLARRLQYDRVLFVADKNPGQPVDGQ